MARYYDYSQMSPFRDLPEEDLYGGRRARPRSPLQQAIAPTPPQPATPQPQPTEERVKPTAPPEPVATYNVVGRTSGSTRSSESPLQAAVRGAQPRTNVARNAIGRAIAIDAPRQQRDSFRDYQDLQDYRNEQQQEQQPQTQQLPPYTGPGPFYHQLGSHNPAKLDPAHPEGMTPKMIVLRAQSQVDVNDPNRLQKVLELIKPYLPEARIVEGRGVNDLLDLSAYGLGNVDIVKNKAFVEGRSPEQRWGWMTETGYGVPGEPSANVIPGSLAPVAPLTAAIGGYTPADLALAQQFGINTEDPLWLEIIRALEEGRTPTFSA